MVFRQHGVAAETAGQFEEHEIARMVAPLLFSFADQDASPTVSARVGTHVIPDGSPQVCYTISFWKIDSNFIFILVVSKFSFTKRHSSAQTKGNVARWSSGYRIYCWN